ncbi:MAG TPA: HAD-IA family hydrolase [Pirellulales bacterium]|nr:HAD-IA family hydrolase [Pirellulales bacterium]
MKPVLTVDAVLFDAVGTLIEPDPPVASAYEAAGRRYGSALSREEVLRRFRAAFARQERLDETELMGRTDEPRERRRWQAIVGEVFDDVADSDGLFDDLWRHFASSAHWRLCAGAADCWRTLAERGLTLGIASNFDARLEAVCQGLAPLDQCRFLFISSRLVGVRKPHPAFFAAIAERLNLPPSRILLAGDDLDNDYRAAEAAGWQSVLIDPAGRHAVERRITSLAELPAFVRCS